MSEIYQPVILKQIRIHKGRRMQAINYDFHNVQVQEVTRFGVPKIEVISRSAWDLLDTWSGK
ncbi:hypothetical protein CPT_Mendera_003 [Stenotrophomonas phage Mendera]|uniref:Uncharacterized protein n=4 Tax=Menderavirus TaxID=2843421 RepID=A0A482IH80_9CAUD|nr:hypothetical protein HWC11_gp009 [Stenotrophomonas phage YB07]YP_009850711.1 hypothetical protein HWC58_gp004 [Stenotrophomonas phage Moby]YP_009851060.1 hypothetical protein HWC60_gp003 [Stenotrophomonas phage Mendera]YP_010667581.1 hypothetical protein PQC01_gp102 [Stenotrophomonas maltophilia phage vB_SmaM_Ps15]QXN67378.1 hypothetical protein [Stenotrophomonas phage BUCT608]QYW02550.1 hypothetical protein CPT_Marzo_008 [Stenotrophomonas phage Marzo]QBP06205.1 hypothetical protein [Steno